MEGLNPQPYVISKILKVELRVLHSGLDDCRPYVN